MSFRYFLAIIFAILVGGGCNKNNIVNDLDHNSAGAVIKSSEKSTPSIVFQPVVKDLHFGSDADSDYTVMSESTVMMYSAGQIMSDEAIKSVVWDYNGAEWNGWTFFSHVTPTKGETISVEITDVDDNVFNETIEVEFSDFCELHTRNSDYGFCLRSNNFSPDGDFIPLNQPFLSFYLDHGEVLSGNLTNRVVKLISANTGEEIDITAATSLSGSNLTINMLVLGPVLEIDLDEKYYLSLSGDYGTVSATFDYDNTNARTQDFKLGSSNLNLFFGENVKQLTIYNSQVPYGQTLTHPIGVSTYNLSYLPSGQYTIYAENDTKEAHASVYIEQFEQVNISFAMQTKDLSSGTRAPLVDSFTVTRFELLSSAYKLKRIQKTTRQKNLERFRQLLNEANQNKASSKMGFDSLIYWNGLTCSSEDMLTPYTEEVFSKNFETVKAMFLNKIAPATAISPAPGMFTSEYPPFPPPLLSVYNLKVNGTVPGGYSTLPNKNTDFGPSNDGVPLQPGKTYAPLIFGEMPLLHLAKSKYHINLAHQCCMSTAADEEEAEPCHWNKKTAEEMWDILAQFFYENHVEVKYTLTGTVNGATRRIEYVLKYSTEDFIKEKGGFDAASWHYIFTTETTPLKDGWVLQKPKYITVPPSFQNPKMKVELLTKVPNDVMTEFSSLNMKYYVMAALVEDERMPSVDRVLAHNVTPIEVTEEVPNNAKQHGRLMLDHTGMLPLYADNHDGHFYENKDRDVEVLLQLTHLQHYKVTGVLLSINYDDHFYPLPTPPDYMAGIKYITPKISWPDPNNQRKISIKFDPTLDDFFVTGNFLDFADDGPNHIELNIQLLLDDKDTTTIEEIVGPSYVLNLSPAFELRNKQRMGYAKEISGRQYSAPSGMYAKKNLAHFFKKLVDSDFNTQTGNGNILRYNDASMPYGGPFEGHKDHQCGYNIDIRYPHSENYIWDQSLSMTFDSPFCSSINYAHMPKLKQKEHHGHKKYLSIMNYLWIKRLAKQIKQTYNSEFSTGMQTQTVETQDHRGDLIQYIANTYCLPTNRNPSASTICNDLRSIYQTANLNDIDALVVYIKETRDNIAEMIDIASGVSIQLIRLSDGAGLTSCFPSSVDLNYDLDWHRKMMVLGKFPDGADAKSGGIKINEWSAYNLDNGTVRGVNVLFSEGDYAHLSHMDITVTTASDIRCEKILKRKK